MSPKQRDYIASLVSERDVPNDAKGTYVLSLIAGTAPEPNRTQLDAIFAWLLALPRKVTGTPDVPDVPAGRYALVHPDRSIVEFFRVDRPEDGRWAGYTFVKQQASDDMYPVRGARAKEVLARIAEDPRTAMLRYGTELGRCGNCGRTLTDEVSRTMGIGPDCAANLGIERISEAEAVAAPKWDGTGPAEYDEYGDVVGPAQQPDGPPPPAPPTDDEVGAGYERADSPTVSTDKQGVPHGVGGWRARKRYAETQLRGEARTVKPTEHSQIEGDLPGETWEDIFGGAA